MKKYLVAQTRPNWFNGLILLLADRTFNFPVAKHVIFSYFDTFTVGYRQRLIYGLPDLKRPNSSAEKRERFQRNEHLLGSFELRKKCNYIINGDFIIFTQPQSIVYFINFVVVEWKISNFCQNRFEFSITLTVFKKFRDPDSGL